MSATLTLSSQREPKWLRELCVILGSSVLIALAGPFSFPLPFTPVPVVLQCHVVLFLAAWLGKRRGTLAIMAFLAQVALGLPLLSGWRGGLHVFAGPTGGYLIGWIVGAYLTGLLYEKSRTPKSAFMALLAGNLAIYAFGYAHLAQFVGAQNAFILGILPFIFGDLFKIFLCVKILTKSASAHLDNAFFRFSDLK